MLWQKALSLYKDFQKKDGTEEEAKPFTVSRGWLHRFRNKFNLKNIIIIGEAASANEEAAATLPAELKKFIKARKCDPRQVFSCDKTRYILHSVLCMVSHNLGRSWNVLLADMGALLCIYIFEIKFENCYNHIIL
jgi:hypothetical protein